VKHRFNDPLDPPDTETKTFWRRHTYPTTCPYRYLPEKCAFARDDRMCLLPPRSWAKQFQKLTAVAAGNGH